MYEHEGKIYARVSDIIKPFVDFGDIDPEVLKRKAELGTRLHEAIDEEIKGGMPVLEPKEAGYFQSWEKWRRALLPEFVETETRYFDDQHMITGCVDALVKFPHTSDNLLTLCDWKTSASESPITWPMQAHLYCFLAERAGKKIAPKFLFIKLDRYGNLPQVFQYRFDPDVMKRCMTAIDDFWRKNTKNVASNSHENV